MRNYLLLFCGDTFLKINELTCARGGSPLILVNELFKSSSYVCVNLETTIGCGGAKVAKAYNFQASPESLQYLLENNVRICSLANNHSYDFGDEGLKETIKNLKYHKIDCIGTHDDNLLVIESNGKKIAICSYYGKEKGLAPLEQQSIVAKVKQHKIIVDIVIVCLHWGDEYVAYPSPQQQQMAHAIIEAGASAVVGHHPHVMQGYESYHGGHIFYSLGNFNMFVDHPYAKRLVETTKAYCVGFTLGKDQTLHYEIIPININKNWQPEVITDMNEVSRFNKYFDAVSRPLKGTITRSFYLAKVSPCHFNNHFPSWQKRIKNYGLGQVLPMLKWLLHPRTYKYYIGTILSLFYKRIEY